jgi:hypothetical protein
MRRASIMPLSLSDAELATVMEAARSILRALVATA